MKYVYLVINWVLGLFVLMFGFFFWGNSVLAGLCLSSISLFLLPPIRNFIHSKTNKELSFKSRGFTILVLLLAFMFFVGQGLQQEKTDNLLKVQQENITYFNNNREEIINSLKKELSNQKYDEVLSLSSKYLTTSDNELKELNLLATAELTKLKSESLLAEVKKIPASQLSRNNDIYKELLVLNPDNELYRKKVDFYTGKILKVEARRERISSQFSEWNGTHLNLERFIKKGMNDPDSYEYDKTVYFDKGDYLTVTTTFRGKNAFGAVVRSFVTAKISLDGQVLQILDQS